MKLLIDFGNSRCKWTSLSTSANHYGLLEVNSYTYRSEDSIQRMQEVFEQICFDAIQEIHAVNVLGDVFEKEFCAYAEQHFSITNKFYSSQANGHGVTLAYANPQSYGVDRYAALIAAHHKSSGAKVIIDCGTATTVDVLDESGKHLGGLIVPGVALMCASLENKASGIGEPNQAGSIQLFSDNTADAVYSGSALVLKHGVQGIIQQIVGNIGQDAAVYVTGGESHMIGIDDIEYVDCPNLVLDGLRIMQG
ncbi:MAG: type III pantothenate kinase [Gammaproteobacteria bacterium]